VQRWWSRLLFWRAPFLEGAVLVNLISDPDTALRGVAWRTRGAWIVLRSASLVKARTEAAVIDGEVIVHRSNVAFIQVLPS
jgi:hypothetical protein